VALAQLLLDYDAEREVEADWGHTPFEWAATLGSERVAGLLLDAGALRLNLWTAAALGTLGIVQESFDGEAVIVGHGRVPAPGADLTGWSLDGPFLTGDALSDAFYIACRNGHFSVAAYLLERGAYVNACGYFGAPALHWAATNRHRDVVEWLLACGDDRSILDPHFDAISEFLGIAPTPEDVQGQQNLLFRDACDAMGISSEPISRNVKGCRGSGECFTGCRSRAKQSMDVSYVPAALRAGARVLTSVQVQQIRHSGREVTGVSGQVVAPFSGSSRRGRSHHFTINAKAVVLAAGCTATPILLKHSDDLANASGQVGENLRFHPGAAIAGIFPEAVDPQFGATQGYQSFAYLEEGFKLETLWAPPPLLSMRFPGYGADLQALFAEIPQMAVWDAIVSANRSTGRVKARWRSLEPSLHWTIHPEDVAIMRRSLHVIAQLFFAAGATKILPGVQGIADVMTNVEETWALASDAVKPENLVMGGNHVFCTTRMHGDPRRGVVDEDGRCHDLENLYIADTGIFPQCPSVNPMLTGMALARRLALVLSARL
jgi:choline dehydrogenase-like flavoprotein